MNRKLNNLLQPSFRLYFICLVLFALMSAAFYWPLACVELGVVLCLGLYSRESARRRRNEINKYLDSYAGTVDSATKDTMINSPLPWCSSARKATTSSGPTTGSSACPASGSTCTTPSCPP